ncbi:hypothetical protein AHMF7605_20955 [Adhaeribacter arboris]|uniref:Uncharacterized protein n=1 Tax=Adhaeribacter arboris TaxID=2072846 RepID=A0A2T2YJV6_9BACT|nr:hypothetical protein [Adhaeribacter arboris]PSR55791.1 hypothetical protein AHMF7605_20955 [Adhaeribacter arboris]
MEEAHKPEPDYQKGFNEGYTIAKHLPELAEQLAKATAENLRGNGFQEGRNQFLSEKAKERYPSWLTGERTSKGENEPTKTMDKDKDIEPER